MSEITRIPLKTFYGKFISKTYDAICFDIEIGGNYFREWFPTSTYWYTEGENRIEVHEWIARTKGLLG